MDKKPTFSLHEFKNWLSSQGDMTNFFNIDSSNYENPDEKFVGKEVVAKVSERKLLERIEPESGEPEQLVQDLIENGGVILAVEGKNLLIEVELGSFYLPRFCLKIKKD